MSHKTSCATHFHRGQPHLSGIRLVNGLPLGDKSGLANGMDCLAAQIVAPLKEEAGDVYLQATGTRDMGVVAEVQLSTGAATRRAFPAKSRPMACCTLTSAYAYLPGSPDRRVRAFAPRSGLPAPHALPSEEGDFWPPSWKVAFARAVPTGSKRTHRPPRGAGGEGHSSQEVSHVRKNLR